MRPHQDISDSTPPAIMMRAHYRPGLYVMIDVVRERACSFT
jgi:hypothetical protein